MTWEALLQIIESEAGEECADRIAQRARQELPGVRITIKKYPTITAKLVDSVAPGKPKEAAKRLGVHQSTIYRVLNKHRMVR